MSGRAAVKTENQTTHFSDVVKIKVVQTITTIVSVLFVSSIPVLLIYLPYKRKISPPQRVVLYQRGRHSLKLKRRIPLKLRLPSESSVEGFLYASVYTHRMTT